MTGGTACVLARAWCWLYTQELREPLRSDRRQEISSDLWEHQRHLAADGRGPVSTGAAILKRVLAGLPADIGWRWEVGRGHLLSVGRPLGLYVRLALLMPLSFGVAQIGRYAPRSEDIYWVGGTGYATFLFSLLAIVALTVVVVARGVRRLWRRRRPPPP